jgi:hypothetical protein
VFSCETKPVQLGQGVAGGLPELVQLRQLLVRVLDLGVQEVYRHGAILNVGSV